MLTLKSIGYLACLAAAGAMGTLARYGMYIIGRRICPRSEFDWGILAANIIGSLLAGIFCGVLEKYSIWKHPYGVLITFGFLGAFTTFSTVMLETGRLMLVGNLLAACANLLLHNVLGILAAFLGLWVAKTTLGM